jgi:hypothetical protein
LRFKQASAVLALSVLSLSAGAQTVLTENFDAGIPGSWTLVNNSVAPLGNSWFQGNAGIFTAFNGPTNSYAAANFVSTNASTGAVSNWLILPALALDSTSTVSFRVRAAGDNFLDTLEVRFSSGTGTDVGTTTTSVGTFTSLLGTYTSSTDQGWVNRTFNLGLPASATGRIAFRYVIADVATAGNYIGIDNVTVTAVPEPATYGLMALGIAGLLIRRRMAA